MRSTASEAGDGVVPGEGEIHVLPPWAPAALIGGGWLALVLVSLVWTYVIATSEGLALSLPEALSQQAVVFVPWIFLLPFVVWLSHRFPFTEGWIRALSAHAVGLCVTLAAHALLGVHLLGWLQPAELEGRGLGALFGEVLAAWLYLSVFTYAATVAAVHAYDYYRTYRSRDRRASRLEARLAEARLAALRGRLQPHFLFNSLQTASGLMDEDRSGAESMLRELAGLLQASTKASRRQLVPLRDELDFVRDYLSIQSTRFRDRLTTRVEIRADVGNPMVPSFLLQPLVENALQHGLEPKRRRGRLEVVARRDAGRLQLIVRDDGGGERAPPPETWEEGVGLATTRERLAGLYGSDAGMDVSVRRAGGVEVRLELPMQREDSDAPRRTETPGTARAPMTWESTR